MRKIKLKRGMNRKGMALVPFLGFLMFIGAASMVIYYHSHAIDASMKFGVAQREIIETYADGEAARQYITHSAKYATHQALYSLGANGGYESPECKPDVWPDCKLMLDNVALETFTCAEEGEETLCKTYEVMDLCIEYPCTYTLQNSIFCGEVEGATVCEVKNDDGEPVNTFECASINSGKCAKYGAAIDQEIEFTPKLNCEEKLYEVECENSDCGAIGEYVYWYADGKTCTPDSEKLRSVFEILFYAYFENYLYDYKVEFDNIKNLYDAVEYDMNLDLASGRIEGLPAKWVRSQILEDEEGNIIGEEEIEEEWFVTFKKEVKDPDEHRPTVTYTYNMNPRFVYNMPYSPTTMFNKIRAKADNALDGIGSCGSDIASSAVAQQESLSSDAEFDWKVSGESVEGACVVKFSATPKNYVVYGVSQEGVTPVVETASPIRFAVKFAGNMPDL